MFKKVILTLQLPYPIKILKIHIAIYLNESYLTNFGNTYLDYPLLVLCVCMYIILKREFK